MIPRLELRRLAYARLADSRALYAAGRYDAALYLCGYAVELALKARICRTLRWGHRRPGTAVDHLRSPHCEGTMSDLVEKLRQVEREIAAESGEFALFALFHIEGDLHENWDLVLAAPWLDEKTKEKTLRRILQVLRTRLNVRDFLRVDRVMILPVVHPDVGALIRRYPAEDRIVEICHRELLGQYIDEGYIITSRPALGCAPDAPVQDASDGARRSPVGRKPGAAQMPEMPRT